MSSLGKASKTREVPSPVQPGEVVAEKYRVERTLAAGGMGVVALARHLGLDQPVALKFLIPIVQDEHTTARFLREARASAKIQSEHVVKVFDCGVPSNLFLANQGGNARLVKVLDFGISKMQPGPDDPVEDDLTGTAMMLGSPRYISPEQAQSSRSVDVRADVWSLGVILYEMIDGKCPFTGDTMGEVLGKILLYRPAPLTEKRPEVPRGLSAVIERCLMRDKELRFESVAALAAALAPFASPRGLLHAERAAAVLGTTIQEALSKPTAASPDVVGATVAEPSDRTVGTWSQSGGEERPRSRHGLTFAVGAAAVAVLVVSGYLLSRGELAGPAADRASSVPLAPAASAPQPDPVREPVTGPPSSATVSVSAAPSPEATSSASSGAPPLPNVRPPPTRPPRPNGGVLDRSD